MTIATRSRNEWLVPSQTTPDVLYLVKRVNGEYTCSCLGNLHYGRCKHVKAVVATLPQTGPSAQDTAAIFMAGRTSTAQKG